MSSLKKTTIIRRRKVASLVKNQGGGRNRATSLAFLKKPRTVLGMSYQSSTTDQTTPDFASIEDAVAAFDESTAELEAARQIMARNAVRRREACVWLRHEAGMKIREVSEVLGISNTRAGEYSGTK